MARIVVDAMGSDNYPSAGCGRISERRARIRSGNHSCRRRMKNPTRAGRGKPRQFTHPNRSRARDADNGRQGRNF